MSKVKEEVFGLSVAFVDPEDLVRIQVIKQKHLDQVQEVEVMPEDGAQIIGRSGVWLVFKIPSYHPDGQIWHLRKIRDMHLMTQVVKRQLAGLTQEEYAGKVELVRAEIWTFLDEQCRQLFIA
jgi:hypothetical protein